MVGLLLVDGVGELCGFCLGVDGGWGRQRCEEGWRTGKTRWSLVVDAGLCCGEMGCRGQGRPVN